MKVKSITIIGRRWFEKVNGNTYHSAEIIVNGKEEHKIEFAYGYDEMYVQNAQQWLYENGYLPRIMLYRQGSMQSMWKYCEDHKIAYHTSVTDVQRKKDL